MHTHSSFFNWLKHDFQAILDILLTFYDGVCFCVSVNVRQWLLYIGHLSVSRRILIWGGVVKMSIAYFIYDGLFATGSLVMRAHHLLMIVCHAPCLQQAALAAALPGNPSLLVRISMLG